ncbi:hypothetical protein FB451DRAFT_1418040 [Mycena latifolia]|nr:hypothetical protein FB451DRAFT_1418040 [Mycena latifolia]
MHGSRLLQFYIRLAFLRWVTVQYPGLTEDTYWFQIDELIDQTRKDCATTDDLDRFYNLIYQDDIKVYGDPANTPYKTAESNGAANSWQAIVIKHSANVLVNPKNSQLIAQAAAAQLAQLSKKRRIESVENEEEEGSGISS